MNLTPIPIPSRPARRRSLRAAALPALIVALLPLAGLAPAAAQTSAAPESAAAPDRQARSWAASCAACHTQAAAASIPSLAGRDAQTLATQLLAFKNGQVPQATVMHQHAKGYTDDELRRIARAIAAGR